VDEAQGRIGIDVAARGLPAHEAADVDGRRVWQTAAILVATIVAAAFAALGAIAFFRHQVGRPLAPVDAPPAAIASPTLQREPSRDLAALRIEKRAMLGEYAWIDRDKGIVRIPIDRAMSVLIERTPAAPR
jgi:hypothetical protein